MWANFFIVTLPAVTTKQPSPVKVCILKSPEVATVPPVADVNVGDSKLAVTFTDAWFIHYEKGGFVIPHAHGQCSWCCVYYVQIGKDATKTNGGTYFQKPTPARGILDFGSYYNKFLNVEADPGEGKMYIWPSHIMHGSYPYEGSEDRIIISANVKVSIIKDGKHLLTV